MKMDYAINQIKRILNREKTAKKDEKFEAIAPDGLPLPSKELVFLVTGQYDQNAFYENSLIGIGCIKEILEKNAIKIDDFKSVLDFGCGCGRIIRHWKKYKGTQLVGLDYNPVFLDFCQNAFPFAKFGKNDFDQSLICKNETFDFIYAISVFTHLPENLQTFWMNELERVLKPGGYIYFTTHGKSRINASHLTDADRDDFLKGNLIVYNENMKGSNLCGTYHPEQYVRNHLAKNFLIIDFIPDGAKDAGQDVYLIMKPQK
jgi:SAM-dependent methyltransferase